jgi:hypothetical protein
VRWEFRFAFGLFLAWVAVTGLFALWHLPAKARYEAGRETALQGSGAETEAAAICHWGASLGAAHPFEASPGEVQLLELLRSEGVDVASVAAAATDLARGKTPAALAKPEDWPLGSRLPELVTLLRAVDARRRGDGIDEEAQGLFVRRPEWWRALLRSWPGDPVATARPEQLAADATVWASLIERREAAVGTGDVFLAFLLLANMVLGLGLWLGSRARKRRPETNTEPTRSEG